MPNVSFIRPELAAVMASYQLIRDCITGETAIKAGTDKYLPVPDSKDPKGKASPRYKAYLKRAVFYNVTRRTLKGLTGQVFVKPPIVKVPTLLESVVKDATGSGVSLTQLCKRSVSLTLAYSRSGVFVDFPKTNGGATSSEVQSGDVRPVIFTYSPFEIINWRVIERGAREILSLVVLAESYQFADDGFEIKNACQFRVLRLDNAGNYIQEIYKENSPNVWDGISQVKNRSFHLKETHIMIGADGNALREIPFRFIGSENNDSTVDEPNFYDLASLNVAHYRNSADYEENSFQYGQNTIVLTGLTDTWYTDVLKGEVNVGSQGGIPLPKEADAKLLQANANTVPFEAMEHKERQMVALGAELVEQRTVQRTAFETGVETVVESSVLQSTAENVKEVYLWALQFAGSLLKLEPSTIEFEIGSDLSIIKATPEEQAKAVSNWQAGALSFKEMRDVLRKAGTATEDDQTVLAEAEERANKIAERESKKQPVAV